MQRRDALAALCAWPALVKAGPRIAHALLVGVSVYPRLNGKALPGAANDVALMARTVEALGVAPEHLTRLAEDALPPTRARIVEALAALAASARPGDWLLVYFSGHGAQVPARSGREGDGLDEVFLPRDTEAWDPERREVRGALRDKDIAAALHRIRARGAHVWAIFDTCHAADMTRQAGSGRGPLWRFASPADLSIPLPLWLKQWQRGLSASPRRRTATVPGHGQFVGFYAAQEGEGAIEERLPDPAAPAETRLYGLFTHRLALAVPQWLAEPQTATFASLAAGVRQGYGDRPFPTPEFVGALERRPDLGRP
ncbi:caspase family protein [Roseateles sp. LKC17W]|uniref:Caspase family protein n=1 Tax=Pelomonas margarita TaxID=3299031 RepID=A0ABW7FG46_9BURK